MRSCACPSWARSVEFLVSMALWASALGFIAFCAGAGVFESPYFRVGPNDTFFFLGVPINTWTRWWSFVLLVGLRNVVEILATDVIHPWILTEVQAPTRPSLPYPKGVVIFVVFTHFTYHDVMNIFAVFISLSQVDVMILNLALSVTITSAFTLPKWLRGKQFPEHIHLPSAEDDAHSLDSF